jgi:hypothetical protein
MTFAIFNRETGVTEDFHLRVYSHRYEDRKGTNWCPVVGSMERPSFLSDTEISFTGLTARFSSTRQGQQHDAVGPRGL